MPEAGDVLAMIPKLAALAGPGRAVAMATVVGVRGASSGRVGAKMYVAAGGAVGGAVTLGGCMDARVIAESEAALATGDARLVAVDLRDEEAWDLGLSCGGTIEVLVERLELGPQAPLWSSYRKAAADAEAGGAACVVRLLHAPARVLRLGSDGRAEGTLGTPALDAEARAVAAAFLARGTAGTQPLGDGAPEESRALFEVVRPRPRLLIVGAGPVAAPLVELARPLGFWIAVLDPRPRFARAERFPAADEVRSGMVSELVAELAVGPSCAVVLVAHDPKVEVPALRAALNARAAYIGMLGSRRRGRAILGALAEEGIDEEALSRIHVPLGLDIGARTPAEIALSALAELVAVSRGRTGASLAAATSRAGGTP